MNQKFIKCITHVKHSDHIKIDRLFILVVLAAIGWTAVIYPELIQQTASLQFCGVHVGDAEIPAGKNLVAKALKAICILNQVTFESRGRP